MTAYDLIWPDGFEDYAWQLEAKGRCSGVVIKVGGRSVKPVFYDPVRLKQDLDEEISSKRYFLERNLIVLETVSREAIEAVVRDLAASGELERMAESEGDR